MTTKPMVELSALMKFRLEELGSIMLLIVSDLCQ